MDFVDLWRCGRIRCLHLIRIASCKTYSLQWFRVLGASFSRFWGLRFRSRVLRFRVLSASFSNLGASFSSFGCFVLRSSFSSASFSKLPGQPSLIACKGLFLSFEFKSYCFSRYRERTTARLKIGRNRSKTAKNANKKQ